jgi:hypothetical protein
MISLHGDLHLERSRDIAGVPIGHGWNCLLENFELVGLGKFNYNGA